MKLSDAVKGYFLDRSFELAETTVKNYRHYFKLFIQFTNDQDIERITKYDVIGFLRHMGEQVQDRTLYDIRARLSSLWTWAESELGIDHIVRKTPRPTYTDKVIQTYTKKDVASLISCARYTSEWITRSGRSTRSRRPTGNRDAAIILALVDSGVRASELCAFTVADYDDNKGRLHVRKGKRNKERFVTIGKRTQKAIWRYLSSRPALADEQPLFATKTEEHIKRSNLYHMITRLGEQAAIRDTTVHRFRHTFAVEYLHNGGNAKELQELLGHEDIKTVMVYVNHVSLDATQRYSPADNWRL